MASLERLEGESYLLIRHVCLELILENQETDHLYGYRA